jgi:putative ABC transport system ATP-binding protein
MAMPRVSALSAPTAPASQDVVRVENIGKTYYGNGLETLVLKGFDMTVTQGEFVAIMGPSGSGKSTFMNILGCLDTPTGGRYLLNGVDIAQQTSNQLAELRNHVLGFVFQGFNLLSRRTILDNVGLPLICAGVDRAEWELRARMLIDRVGLKGQELKQPSQLSGGQQQRVAIARALAGNPRIILADEPTGNLDTATSVSIMELFTELNQKEGITIILVTHEEDVAAYANRLVVLRDGNLVYDGAPRDYKGHHSL